jgi:NADH pyrophosphatase NudC (nudix superfamily)
MLSTLSVNKVFTFLLFHFWICLTDSMKVFYSDPQFQRRTVSQDQFSSILDSPLTQFVPVNDGENFYIEHSKKPIFLNVKDLQEQNISEKTGNLFVYLGSKAGVEFVAVDLLVEKRHRLTDMVPPPLPVTLRQDGVKCKNLRSFSEELVDMDDASLLAHSRGMLVWHSNTQYCCKCGTRTKSQRAGASRKCTNEGCKASSYPRLEPASIMLITDRSGSHCLLGRKAAWPQVRTSVLPLFPPRVHSFVLFLTLSLSLPPSLSLPFSLRVVIQL